ncbi:hypothetical protein DRN63_05415 [Nanoarchaeota archaeon]|nr:MAG: hypothetical protein DRN63_05415 [Nanoarchaeota archaeon]
MTSRIDRNAIKPNFPPYPLTLLKRNHKIVAAIEAKKIKYNDFITRDEDMPIKHPQYALPAYFLKSTPNIKPKRLAENTGLV